ncbi:MAG TPA: hypothetical protein VK872_06845, partial [Draconibacterium sp.]|nr:hypothetical protein [Draconibacterium sp.]
MKRLHTLKIFILVFVFWLPVVSLAYSQSVDKIRVEKYGAVADGRTLNTQALQKAIDDVSEKGG